MGMIVMRVGVVELVRRTVLDNLTVSADMEMPIREDRRQYTERDCHPGEIEILADHHEASGFPHPNKPLPP